MRVSMKFGGWLATACGTLAIAGVAEAQYSPYAPYAQAQQPYYQNYAGVQSPAQGYGGYAGQPYMVAQAQSPAATPTPTDNLSLTPPSEGLAPGAMPGGAMAPMQQSVPMTENYAAPKGMANYGAPMNAGCNCQQGATAPMAYQNYAPAASAAGCATGGCGNGYGGGSYGACDTSGYGYGSCNANGGNCGNNGYSTYGPSMGGMLGRGSGGYWFGGVYGLLMDRSNSDKFAMVMSTPSAGPYPPSSDIVLTTQSANIGYQPGIEFRVGHTFGCNPCTCMPQWGLEAVYWQLFDSDARADFSDDGLGGPNRTYGMRDYRGLEANMGLGYRPVNHYFDYGPPVSDYTNGGALDRLIVTNVYVRNTFQAQNLELNLLRLSLCSGGCVGSTGVGAMGGGCGSGYGSCGGGGGDSCGGGSCGGCDSGCGSGDSMCGSGPCGGGGGCGCGQRYFLTGMCGIRYMQFDESFTNGTSFYNVDQNTNGFINYHSRTKNNLVGPQIGANGMYRVGCKWGLHLNSAVGIFGNGISTRQYFDLPTGGVVRDISDQVNFDSRGKRTEFSTVAELRAGVSYQATCRMRLYGGWWVIGVTGYADAVNQSPSAFIDNPQITNYVNSHNSLVLQGLQTGLEWNY